MNIVLQNSQPLHIIAQRFCGKLHNRETFYVDLWKEEGSVMVVVYYPQGRALTSLDDFSFEDRTTINNMIVRHAAPLFGRREAF